MSVTSKDKVDSLLHKQALLFFLRFFITLLTVAHRTTALTVRTGVPQSKTNDCAVE